MITKEIFREKAKEGIFSEEEISHIEHALESMKNVENNRMQNRKGNAGFSGILKDFFKGYNAPRIWNQITESALILCILIGIIIFGYAGKLEPIVVSTLIATIIGFVFGKMRY